METCQHCGQVIKKKSKADPNAKKLIQHYNDTFYLKFNHIPDINWPACTMAAKKLLRSHSIEDLQQLVNVYLDSEDEWFKNTGFKFLLFPTWLQSRVVIGVKPQAVVSGNNIYVSRYQETEIPAYKR